MEINYPHNLTREEVYTRVNELFPKLQASYNISNPQTRWNSSHTQMDFSAEISRFNIRGSVYLRDSSVSLEAKLPFLARMFSGKIEDIISKELKDLFS